jgi:exodeoxyribonuclease V beta subunit
MNAVIPFDAAAPLKPGMHRLTGGPGTGKTHQLVQIVARLHREQACPLDRILVVVPRRAAGHQVRAALATVLPDAPLHALAVLDPYALAQHLQTELGAHLSLAPKRLLHRAEALDAQHVVADFWSRVVARAPADRVRALDKLKPETLVAIAEAADADPTCAWLPTDANAAFNLQRAVAEHARHAVPAERAARGVALPRDVFTAFARALSERPAAVQAAAQHRYDAVLVDDAADLDPAAIYTLAHLLGPQGHTWLAADPEQVIGREPTGRAAWQALQGPRQRLGVNHRAAPDLARGLAQLWDPARLGLETAPPAWPQPGTGGGLELRWLAPTPPGADALIWAADRAADDVAHWLTEPDHALTDVAVLVSTHAEADAMERALRRLQLPVARFGGESVYASDVAADLSLLLRAVVERDAGIVRGALATELGGLDAVGVAALLEDEAAWTIWSDRFRGWATRWAEAGVLPMVQMMRAELGLDRRWLRHSNGARRLADLRDLAERLHAEAAYHQLGPAALVARFEAARAAARPGEASQRLADDAPAVAVRTVHAARGRQWAMVFVPFGWRPPALGRWPRAIGPDGPAADLRGLKGDPGLRTAAHHHAQARAVRSLRTALGRATQRAALYWGPLTDAGRSGLATVLFPQPTWPDRVERHVADARPEALHEELKTLSEHLPVRPAGEHLEHPPRHIVAPEPLQQRTWARTAPLDQSWCRTSFSGLTRDAHHVGVGGADEVEDDTLSVASAGDTDPVPMLDLPAGAVTGTCLHAILEAWDFQQPDQLRAAVEQGLHEHGLDPELAELVTTSLAAVAQTPLLPEGLRLCDLPRSARLDELDFVCPMHHTLTPADLAADLRAWPGPDLPADYAEHLAALPTGPVRGFLSGSIDLVFRWRDRWYLVDYKSNRLGDTFADYTPARLSRAMVDSHYLLQAHLYAVALHRFLRWRLGDAYQPARDFGGVAYLFLRGMHPEHGHRRGVWFARPPVERIAALSARLGDAP